jgi:hypothetical protein
MDARAAILGLFELSLLLPFLLVFPSVALSHASTRPLLPSYLHLLNHLLLLEFPESQRFLRGQLLILAKRIAPVAVR